MTARPGYVAYRNSLRALQMEPVEVECGAADRFQIHARHIREADPAPDGLIEIGREHVCTPVTNAHLVCRLPLENKTQKTQNPTQCISRRSNQHTNSIRLFNNLIGAI